jgi:glycosyltransferase involved in cell wall biosynthesis
MKIGFDISALCLPRSGVGQYQYQLLRHLLKIDRQNNYSLYAFNFRSRERFKELKLEAHNSHMRVFPIPQKLMALSWLTAGTPSIDKVTGGADVCQVSEICIPPAKQTKRVAFVHDLTPLLFPQYHSKTNVFLQKIRFSKLGEVDAILTNSEATKKDIVERLGLGSEKIYVTPLGAGEHFRPMVERETKPVLAKFGLRKPYILFVGTLEPRKNLVTLVQAFNRLKSENGIPHQLVLAGRKGWLYESLMAEIGRSPYAADIRLTGYVADEEVPALISAADAFAYPSFYEGFGLPVLEAMQCGTPVVTSAISSLPEVGGDACLYADPHSEAELADRLFLILNDAEFRRQLSEKGIQRAKQFSWERCARETLKVYESLA